jgi:tetratricopeptide (TPR) repeat protein
MMWRAASQAPFAGRFARPAEPELVPANPAPPRLLYSSKRLRFCRLFSLLFCALAAPRSITAQGTQTTPDSAANELSRRLEAAVAARKSGDLGAITLASERVIALGLVAMAKLQLDGKAYEEAAKLCRESLEFEDTSETRVELAIVNLYARKPADAVVHSSLAIEKDPQDALAWNIKGEAQLQQEDYAGAAASLGRSVELKQDAESIYALGIAYIGVGEKQKAADSFSQLLALVGNRGWSRVLVGRAYQQQKLPQEAEAEYQNALMLDPRTPTAHYFWALALLEANGWSPTAEVRWHLMEELKLNPDHLLANYLLGYFASIEGNFDESDHYLQRAAKINPSLPETWMFLGLNAHRRNSSRVAEAFLRKSIALAAKDNPKGHPSIRKAYFILGRILLSSGREKEGEQLLQKVVQLRQESLAESQKKGAAKYSKDGADATGDNVPYIPEAEARNTLSIAANQGLSDGADSPPVPRAGPRSPQDPATKSEKHLRSLLGSALNDLATAEALQEKYDLAVKHYREAAGWDAQIPGLQRNLGLAAFFVGEYGEAIRLLAKVVTAAPSDAHARAVLGLAYFAKEDFAKVIQTVSPIADRALQDVQVGFAWAKSLAETGSRRAAENALENLEKTNLSLSGEGLTKFGQLWMELGEAERAERSFRQALLLNPADSDVKCDLGIALLRLSRMREAADLFLSVIADRPDHPEARYQLGRALLEMGNVSEAVRHLEEAARVQPARLSVHLDLEAAYRKAGRTVEADREHALSLSLKNHHQARAGNRRKEPSK